MESWLEKIFSMGINSMSLAVWLGEDRKCSAAVQEMFCSCSRFRFVVRVIYGVAVFIKSVF